MRQLSRGLLLGTLLGLLLLGVTWLVTQLDLAPWPVSAAPAPSDTPSPDPVEVAAPVAAAPIPTLPDLPAPTDTPNPERPAVIPSPTADCRTQSDGVIVKGTFPSAMLGQQRPYRVYLPPCYHAGDPAFPVLYMLHGSASDDSQWDEDGLDEAATAAIRAGEAAPFVIAMPAGDLNGTYNYSSGGPGSFEQLMLDEFLPFIELNYNVRSDREGRAIGGLSRGAVWALEIAFRHPDMFLSVGSHSGAQSVALAAPPFNPLALAAQAPGIETLRIYLDSGKDDWYLDGQQQLHDILAARGAVHLFVLNPGGHEDSYWQAHVQQYVAFYSAPWSAGR